MEKEDKIQNHGFIPDTISETDYVFGAQLVPQVVLRETGQWNEFLPETELQERNGLETLNCVTYGTLNCIEILFKRLFNEEINKSERYIGVMAETSRNGNTPQRVIEVIRKTAGLIDENLLPFDETIDTWDKYYSPKPMYQSLIRKGEEWLEEYEVKHEWVFFPNETQKSEKLMEALKFSPLGVSVFAWQQDEDGLYIKPEGKADNHWCTLYGYKRGEHWKIFDHYNDTTKELAWDYDFGLAKRYYLEKKTQPEKEWSLWSRLQEIKLCLQELLRKLSTIQGD